MGQENRRDRHIRLRAQARMACQRDGAVDCGCVPCQSRRLLAKPEADEVASRKPGDTLDLDGDFQINAATNAILRVTLEASMGKPGTVIFSEALAAAVIVAQRAKVSRERFLAECGDCFDFFAKVMES